MGITTIVIVLVALTHFGFLLLEMVLWTHPTGRRVFGLTPEFAIRTRKLAANQGLYNGLFASGLVTGLILGHRGEPLLLFLLSAIAVAGLYGAYSIDQRIFWIQALPALLALLLLQVSP